MNELFIAVKGALIFTIAWIALMAFLTWENPLRHTRLYRQNLCGNRCSYLIALVTERKTYEKKTT
ncbi:TPA: hypothetical protein ACHGDV_005720 [Escherichia coli]